MEASHPRLHAGTSHSSQTVADRTSNPTYLRLSIACPRSLLSACFTRGRNTFNQRTCRKTQQQYLSHAQQYTANRIINSHCNSLCNLKLLTVAHSTSAISSAPSKTGSISSAAQSQRPRRRRSGGKVARLVPIQPPGSHYCASTVRRRSFNVLFCMVLHTMPVHNISQHSQTYDQTNKAIHFLPHLVANHI